MTTKKVWIQCAVAGEFKGHKTGPFSMTAETFDECVRNFDRDGVEIPWDINHQSEQGTGAVPAVGWISKLERRGSALYGLTEWLPETSLAIQAKRWQYASPAIRFGAIDPKSGQNVGAKLSSMGLVLRGFLKDLAPVQASDDASGTVVYCSEVPFASDDDEHELITMAEHEQQLAAAVAKTSEAQAVLLADTAAERDVAEARATALATQIKLMTDRADDALVEERFQLYRESRKLGPNSKKVMRALLSDRPLFHAEYPPLPSNVPAYMTRKLSDDQSGSAALSGMKTVPDFAVLLAETKEQNPAADFDRVFDLTLARQATLMGAAA